MLEIYLLGLRNPSYGLSLFWRCPLLLRKNSREESSLNRSQLNLADHFHFIGEGIPGDSHRFGSRRKFYWALGLLQSVGKLVDATVDFLKLLYELPNALGKVIAGRSLAFGTEI